MQRAAVLFLLIFTGSILLHGQASQTDANAWLNASTETAAVNVTGIWNGGDWGLVSLTQQQGGRRIIGTADGWDVTGVVSGKTVYLLLWKKDTVAFSAKLSIDGTGQLTGVYAKGILSAAAKTVPMQLKK
jgi:hypothetical protein